MGLPSNNRRLAFSLAEMMIALVILGLGLIFIAAALPVGVEYTRRTAELAQAEAAGQSALDTLQQHVRTARFGVRHQYGTFPVASPPRLDMIFRSRQGLATQGYPLVPEVNTSPRIKVRPLIAANIDLTPGALPPTGSRGREVPDSGEELLRAIFASPDINFPQHFPPIPLPLTANVDLPAVGERLFDNPTLTAAARVYPPISSDLRRGVLPFIQNASGEKYASTPLRDEFEDATNPVIDLGREARKLLDRRVVWTAFYRRVSYTLPAPNAIYDGAVVLPNGQPAVRPGDPLTYEFIVVLCRRQTDNHRFARQDGSAFPALVGAGSPQQPRAMSPGVSGALGSDRLAPEPWLVSFTSLPTPGAGVQFQTLGRDWDPNNPHRTTLRFFCTPELGSILPVGSVLIPAMNDVGAAGTQRVGFVPNLPDALPIYEVIDRPDATTVVVRGNGVYPWLNNGVNPREFLFWTIPPAFTDRPNAGSQPVWERRSPILSVVRRVVRLPEVE